MWVYPFKYVKSFITSVTILASFVAIFVNWPRHALRPLQNAPFCLPLLRDVRLNILHEVTRSEASALTFSAILKILNVWMLVPI